MANGLAYRAKGEGCWQVFRDSRSLGWLERRGDFWVARVNARDKGRGWLSKHEAVNDLIERPRPPPKPKLRKPRRKL